MNNGTNPEDGVTVKAPNSIKDNSQEKDSNE